LDAGDALLPSRAWVVDDQDRARRKPSKEQRRDQEANEQSGDRYRTL
jgi:hypothetical protein